MSRQTLIAFALASSLTACVVVPVDPRTGLPYPHAPVSPHTHTQTQPVLAAPAAPLASTIGVRLYPLNDIAGASGMLNATVVDHHSGKGSFSLNYRGDTLQGEATRVDGGYAAFGRLHDDVLGRSPRAFSGQRGIANAVGPRGVNAQCEYVISGPARGTGVCLFSDGARYQMHFGV